MLRVVMIISAGDLRRGIFHSAPVARAHPRSAVRSGIKAGRTPEVDVGERDIITGERRVYPRGAIVDV